LLYLVGKGVAGVPVLLAGAYMNRCGWCRKSVLIADDMPLQNKDIHGNGHMVMIGKNNLAIAKVTDD
jgi:hypothetical protein